ncbi:sugar ABC transporter substrate-binding protein [Kutzneria sp. CA-103260]|uniref:sugar ABC transporter substrate-binding protein n=1 Tax=Kutzneria sp. CA-103260 TaxID=2802641 RepID=UPI001BAB6DCC|nr:substrate-binding domain-containing protein [Kutzneria sp. CA-103260]QUQ71672.1 Periplasmic binding protein domain protein [Kutzneria sp. CA-103260]
MRTSPLTIAVLAIALCVAGCSRSTVHSDQSALAPGQVKVALVPGGPHPYFQPWKAALQQAKTDFKLGDTTFNETSAWNQTTQNSVLKSLAAQGFNAFGVFGVSPDTINSTFSDLRKQGFHLASLGSCPAGDTDNADFCLATDVQQAAYKAAKSAIEAMGGSGNLVHLTGNKTDSNTTRRIQGVQQAIDETGGKVKLLQTVTDIDTDLQTAQKAVADLIAAKGAQINGIVTTAYNPAVASAAAVKAARLNIAGLPVKVVAIDDDPTILGDIKDGSVTASVVQNPVGQAYVGSYALTKLAGGCTMKTSGQVIDSGSFVVTKDNVASYDTQRQQETAQLRKDFDDKYLTCPKA